MSKLTDAIIMAAPLPSSGYKALTDGQRLFLRITPDGSRFWRLKYVAHGKDPPVSIAQARLAADAMRSEVSAGKNPIREKRDIKEAIQDAKSLTFGRVAQEWLAYATTPTGAPWGGRTREEHTREI